METITNFYSISLSYILSLLFFSLKCIYTTIPAIFANMAPILAKKIPSLNHPIDFGLKINGKPLLGKNKTFKGMIAGILFSMAVFYIQYLLYKYTALRNLSLINFEKVNVYFIGLLVGFGVIFGDIVESFVKRRLDIPPSKSFIPWDQVDCALGGLIFARIAWAFPVQYAVTILILTFFIHVSLRHLAYYIGLCENKW